MGTPYKEYEEWSPEATYDQEQRIVRNVLLCGNKSRNGYAIPESAFGSRAMSLYEGKPVFVNHSDGNPKNRDLRDLVGYVQNVRMEAGRPRGDISVLETNAGAVFTAMAKSPRKGFGMSHVALYKFGKGRTSVESVEEVVSVDVVHSPATTDTFTEKTNGDNPVDEQALKVLQDRIATLESDNAKLKAEGDVLKADVKAFSEKNAVATESLKTLTAERDALKAKADLADRAEAIAAELIEAKIDPSDKTVCSETFMKLLKATAESADRKALIVDRVALVGESAKVVIGQGAGKSSTEGASTFDAFTKGQSLFV
jgi:hypothetical protein